MVPLALTVLQVLPPTPLKKHNFAHGPIPDFEADVTSAGQVGCKD